MTRKPLRDPLIAIIGATGTGKSQLAVELARRFNGEIINGDAMQLYAGLPIITNKITVEEQKGIPHHLLGCIGLEEPTWVVGTFVQNALRTIGDIRARGKLPILVGGTHYYTQSLLFHGGLADEDGKQEGQLEEAEPEETDLSALNQSAEVLLEELRRVDPVMADRWHPNDRRKIQRSLEIYLKTGKRASEVYAAQRDTRDGDASEMRFSTLLLWVYTEMDTLRSRLDQRVDKMIEAGLLNEVRTLNKYAQEETQAGRPVDETRGIWVSIGYKEFRDYVKLLDSSNFDPKMAAKLSAEATAKTKIATRQYAKRQIRWIRIKLMNSLRSASAFDQLYALDSSVVADFDRSVVGNAIDLAQLFLEASPVPPPESVWPGAVALLQPSREYDLSAAPGKWEKHRCEVCNVTCVVPEQWEQHVKSKSHKKAVSKQRQREETVRRSAEMRSG